MTLNPVLLAPMVGKIQMARKSTSRRASAYSRGGSATHSSGWYWLIIIILVLSVGGSVVTYQLWFKPPEYNKSTLCPKTGPEAGLVILLDLTDRIGATQHIRLRSILEKEVLDARQNTLIAVGAVNPNPGKRGIDFALCKPLEGSAANQLYQNPRLITKKYEMGFQKPFAASLEKMLKAERADRSPIMESLQAALAATPGFVDAEYPRRVIIVSDLLQHSAVFSFYRRDTWRKFQRSRDFERLARTLHGVDVQILRLPRPKARIDPVEVGDFWVNYFDQAGARRIRYRMLGDL